MESIPPALDSSAAATSVLDNNVNDLLEQDEQEDEVMYSPSPCSAAATPSSKRPPIERVSKKRTCWAWEFIYKLSNDAFVNSRPSSVQKEGIPCQFICRLCYEDATNLPIIDCVVALHKNGISNGISHLLFKHNLSDPNSTTNKKKKKALTPPMNSSMLLGQSSSSSDGIGTLQKFLNGGNNRQLRHVHSLAARLVVNNKLPLSTTTSDDFNELIHAASHLKIGSYIPMTKRKMDYLLVQMFASFIADVRALIAATRALFVYDNPTKDVKRC